MHFHVLCEIDEIPEKEHGSCERDVGKCTAQIKRWEMHGPDDLLGCKGTCRASKVGVRRTPKRLIKREGVHCERRIWLHGQEGALFPSPAPAEVGGVHDRSPLTRVLKCGL